VGEVDLAWQVVESRGVCQLVFPISTTGPAYVGLGRQRDRRIQAASGHSNALAALQRVGKRRSALRAEALLVARPCETECVDVFRAGLPDKMRASREKRGGVRRAGVLATPAAMAKIKMFKWAIDFKSDSPTQACAAMGISHGKSIA